MLKIAHIIFPKTKSFLFIYFLPNFQFELYFLYSFIHVTFTTILYSKAFIAISTF